ncbi:hypothetical protein CP871_04630, partial [Cutibacterium acnes]
MRVGVPTEVKNNEFRVAVTPAGVHALVGRGHEVLVQAGAGVGSGISDSDFVGAGARVVGDVESVWGDADLVLKVKEPVAEEYGRLHEGLVLFTYLHLATDEVLTRELLGRPLMDIGLVLALEPQLRFPAWDWLLVSLSLPVVFWSAWPFHKAT